MTKQNHKATQRKKDHINLAFESTISSDQIDPRFYYEPILSGHPSDLSLEKRFLNKILKVPIWISSMTGGTELGRTINENLARACHDFGMGMGLGSCRALLQSDEYLDDFNVRHLIGDELPFYGNLGIAQAESLVKSKNLDQLRNLVEKLQLDGIILHINPMQEWFQPEGDHISQSPLDTIQWILDVADYPIIIKEVGQGMGIQSLSALLRLPIAAIDFGASGGTNFALLELLRSDDVWLKELSPLTHVGHSAEEMVNLINDLDKTLGQERQCKEIIISGGIRTFLDGYYLINRCNLNSVYGQASAFLKYAMGSYDQLYKFVQTQVEGLRMAQAFLTVKK